MDIATQDKALEAARQTVLDYLGAMQDRDLDAAGKFLVPEPDLRFPGGVRPKSPSAIAESTAQRYQSVAKKIEKASAWVDGDAIRVLVHGTLYGAWVDGEPFEGVAFMDLFRVRDGLIESQHVLNESAEIVLKRTA